MIGSDPPDDISGLGSRTDSLLAQLAFNAAWDLRTQWRRGNRLRADEYDKRLGSEVCAVSEVRNALREAERIAHSEGVEPSAEPESGHQYPYLSPPIASGELGRLGHFRVIRKVGEGGMGVVFEAEPVGTLLESKRRALKILAPEKRTNEFDARFEREAQAIEKIQDAHVVRLHTAGMLEGVAYLELEYVYGPTLGDLIRHHAGNPVPWRLAADLIRQTAIGLAAAHRQKPFVIHRDVKPGNILLEWVLGDDTYLYGWRARVCDFGLALVEGQTPLTRLGFVPGTLPYMSPQQLAPGSGPADRPDDVFALGITAYELSTGRHPFKGNTPAATVHNIRAAKVVSPHAPGHSLPEAFAGVILQMLNGQPEKRPSAEGVAAQLAALLDSDEAAPAAGTEPTVGLVERVDEKAEVIRAMSVAARPASTRHKIMLAWPDGRRSILIAQDRLTVGRDCFRQNDVVLRWIPTRDLNKTLTEEISATHFRFMLAAKGVEVEDLGSRHGTMLAGVPLEPGTPKPIWPTQSGVEIVVAGTFRLRVWTYPTVSVDQGDLRATDRPFRDGIDASHIPPLWGRAEQAGLDAARLERLSNLCHEEYVLLFRQLMLGPGTACPLSLPIDESSRQVARVIHSGDRFWLERLAEQLPITVNGQGLGNRGRAPLDVGQSVLLGKMRLQVCAPEQELN